MDGSSGAPAGAPTFFVGEAEIRAVVERAAPRLSALVNAEACAAIARRALYQRRAEPDLGDGTLRWLPTEPDVLSFARGDEFACVVNLSDRAVPLPPHREVILSSAPVVEDNLLAADSAAWLRLQRNE